jgi:hypothetical protein
MNNLVVNQWRSAELTVHRRDGITFGASLKTFIFPPSSANIAIAGYRHHIFFPAISPFPP